MDILDRIQVVQSRQDFRMCVPPQQDDTDVVLEDCRKEIESLRQQLAAALAACEAKDAEVKEMRSGDPEYVYYACKRILAIKPDASAIRELKA